MQELHKFNFPRQTSRTEVDSCLILARLAVDAIHGEAVSTLEAPYSYHRHAGVCIIPVDTQPGRHLACVFTGLLLHFVGEEGFDVERITKPSGVAA